uniref:Uncharacterized protein n=1 Tax=Timema poppense TaxID=170557 RepID=A0A7R9DK37_TIMPO|nr:unnamed protein product [Timema poppensis]
MPVARQSFWSEQLQLKFAALEEQVREELLTRKGLGVKLFELLQDLDIPNSVLEAIRELQNHLNQQRLSQLQFMEQAGDLLKLVSTNSVSPGSICKSLVQGTPGSVPRSTRNSPNVSDIIDPGPSTSRKSFIVSHSFTSSLNYCL